MVDTERRIIALGGEFHMDADQILISFKGGTAKTIGFGASL